jgi:hypothetical protein
MLVKRILWYGADPLPGIEHRLEVRGFSIEHNPSASLIQDAALSGTLVVVINHAEGDDEHVERAYEHVPAFIDHGIRVLILYAEHADRATILAERLVPLDESYEWDKCVRFLPDLRGPHFDVIVDCPAGSRWRHFSIQEFGKTEKLCDEEKLLVARAFDKAEELHLRLIMSGRSGSKVLMAYEKRREKLSSIGHWTQPRLVKIGKRAELMKEVGAMKEVSPFVPFELRPHLEVFVEGLRNAAYVADFVDKSESLFDAAKAGRAEAAISNLFNRTLYRWRERANQGPRIEGALVDAAERLAIASPLWICDEYLQTERIRKLRLNVFDLWAKLQKHTFPYRAATIHGDLHGDNVRVRGDDAILIDLGAVRGSTNDGDGAPLCFDVATLEVSLVFEQENNSPNDFEQPAWEREIRPFYDLEAILSTPSIETAPRPDSWLFGCLTRIRAFGIYEQSDHFEYAIALVIALWRFCKFNSSCPGDKGRRVVALQIGAELIQQIEKKLEGDKNSR